MKKIFVIMAMFCFAFAAKAQNKCEFKDENNQTRRGTITQVSSSWTANKTAAESTTVEGGVKSDLKIIGGGVNTSESKNSSSASTTTQTLTREACCDRNNVCETVDYEMGWSSTRQKKEKSKSKSKWF